MARRSSQVQLHATTSKTYTRIDIRLPQQHRGLKSSSVRCRPTKSEIVCCCIVTLCEWRVRLLVFLRATNHDRRARTVVPELELPLTRPAPASVPHAKAGIGFPMVPMIEFHELHCFHRSQGRPLVVRTLPSPAFGSPPFGPVLVDSSGLSPLSCDL